MRCWPRWYSSCAYSLALSRVVRLMRIKKSSLPAKSVEVTVGLTMTIPAWLLSGTATCDNVLGQSNGSPFDYSFDYAFTLTP